MTQTEHELFWREVKSIQARHSLFFSPSQMKFIHIINTGSSYSITYDPECELPEVVKLEIGTALKLVLG